MEVDAELVSLGFFLQSCPADVWESVFLRLDVPSAWRMAGVCQAWRCVLASEQFWKQYCAMRPGWDYKRGLKKMAKKEERAVKKSEKKGYRKRRTYVAAFGVYPYLCPVRLFGRQRFLKSEKRRMMDAVNPAALELLKNHQARRAFGMDVKGFLDEVLRLDPNFGPALNKRALVMFDAEQYEETLEDLERVVKLYPYFTDALSNLGLAYHEAGRYDKALCQYRRAVALEGDAITYNNLGLLHNDMGDNRQAVQHFTTILTQLSPRFVDAYNNRAFAYNALGLYEEAAADCELALRLKPHLAEPRRIRAYSWYRMGRLDEAIQEATDAIERFGAFYSKAYYTRGLALRTKAELCDDPVLKQQLAMAGDVDIAAAVKDCPTVAQDL